MSIRGAIRYLLGARKAPLVQLAPLAPTSAVANTTICPMTPPPDDWPPLGSTTVVKRPFRMVLGDGRTVDVLAVATYEAGTAEPISLHYEPLSFFVPRKDER